MAGVYALLGFDTTDPIANGAVEQLSPSVQTQMKMMPPLMQPWQETDLISNETEQYYLNPVSNTINVIWSTSNTITNLSFSNVITGTINVTFSNPGVSSSFLISFCPLGIDWIGECCTSTCYFG